MKILYLTRNQLPERTANSVQITNMCNALGKTGHSVTLFTGLQKSERFVKKYYGVDDEFKIRKSSFFNIRKIRQAHYSLNAYNHLKHHSYDLIYSRHLYCLLLCFHRSEPKILEIHEECKNEFERMVFEYLVKNAINLFIVTNSERLRRILLGHYDFLSPDRVLSAQNSAQPLKNINGNYDYRGTFKAGFLGSFKRGKGLDMIIHLSGEVSDIKFYVFGGGGDRLKKYKSRYESRNLKFFGFIEPCKVQKYLKEMDVVLAPLQRKIITNSGLNIADYTSPLKIFEYMASGRPIIASDLPAIHEILEDKTDALMEQPDNVDSWVEALHKLKTNRKLRRKLGKQAQSKQNEKYTWKQRALRIMKWIFDQKDFQKGSIH